MNKSESYFKSSYIHHVNKKQTGNNGTKMVKKKRDYGKMATSVLHIRISLFAAFHSSVVFPSYYFACIHVKCRFHQRQKINFLKGKRKCTICIVYIAEWQMAKNGMK